MGINLNGKELGKGLSQRKDGTYMGRYVDRFGNRQCVYSKNLADARQKLAIAEAKVVERRDIIKNIKLNDWFLVWFDVYKRGAVKMNTLVNYEMVYRVHIKDELGHLNLADITKTRIQMLINDMHEAGQGYEQQNKVRILLIDMLNRAMEDDYLVKNPAKGVRTRVTKDKDDINYLSKEDADDFFKYSVASFYDNAFHVHINTGLRPGELFGLYPSDINFEENYIDVCKTLVYAKFEGDEKKEFHLETPKTKTSYRKVPINSACREYLKDQLRIKDIVSVKHPNTDCPYLFTSSINTPINAQMYIDAISAVVKSVNYRRGTLDVMDYFSGHTFRHTFATRCFEAGIPPKVVQKYLGHATLQMTMDLYTHVTEEKAQADIEKICLDDYMKV